METTNQTTLDALRTKVSALDPLILEAVADVDRNLIALSLEQSPLMRLAAATRAGHTLAGFRSARAPGV